MEQSQLNEVVKKILETCNPSKIVMFGSNARNDANDQSDIDLLVIEREDKDKLIESYGIREALRFSKLPIEIVVTSEKEYEYWRYTIGHLFYEINKEGIVLYEAA